ncbi:hypothetical protein [Leucobacter luti]|uniref:hypothetical protein n=1 Tax=Leucobacter luti TaxID=340320 RepID=UPI003D061FD0
MPTENSAWPPPQWLAAYIAYEENNAWWTGDRTALAGLYGTGGGKRPGVTGRSSSNVIRALMQSIRERGRTFFWGGKGQTLTDSRPVLRSHIPAAANLATLSSDLQFAQSPRFLIPGEESDSKDEGAVLLRDLMDADRSRAQLNIYGETKAALGASICIPMWDADLAPGEVWWESFGPDTAIPEFRSGRLAAVTLWSEYQDDRQYYRLLSHHGVDGGAGYVEHALFLGTEDNLGKRVPLQDHPLGEPYADMVDADSRIPTGLHRLDAVYGVNAPTVEWRRDPFLRYAGRSDFAQLHGLFDDLDRSWSSWMRDLRLGAGRTFMPSQYLTSLGRGKGATFDEVAEYVTKLDMPGDLTDGKLPIHHQQHEIRVEQHERTLMAGYREILRKAGYSPSAWGDNAGEGGGQITATEIEDRNAASERTRAKKNVHDRQTLGELARLVMEVHSVQYGGGLKVLDALPIVEFPEMSQEPPRDLAETVGLLDAAGAISLLQKVTRANPDWTSTQVTEEVERIRGERGEGPLPDPAALGRVASAIEEQDDIEDDDGDDDER